ncbi:hypothetical protein H0H87_010747, partial [Tephrocybe sp. NHM501043]
MPRAQAQILRSSFATMVAHGQSLLLSTGHSTAPTDSNTALDSTTTNLVETTAKLAKEVGELLKN